MKIGILGGGQLGRMLWEASSHLKKDLSPSPIFHETKNCPAVFAGAQVIEAKISDTKALTEFFQSTDTFAIENEFLSLADLKNAWSQAGKSDAIPRPSWQGLEIAQDKLEQKKFFVQEGLPTSEFVELTPQDLNLENNENLAKLIQLHSSWQGLVLKRARMGYDGKGNYLLPPMDSHALNVEMDKLRSFCKDTFAAGSRLYAERFVPFEREVAIVSARSFSGDFGHYPLVETVQKKGVCFLAYSATDQGAHKARAAEIARHIGQKLHLLGTFAIEFFVTSSNELIVNEMAPRVHNSGHFTQKAARSNQFEMHLKSYYQKTFEASDFQCSRAFAMVNLLGPDGLNKPVSSPGVEGIYWYDKERTSPGRKLGHIIAHGSDEKDLQRLIDGLLQKELQWQESLK